MQKRPGLLKVNNSISLGIAALVGAIARVIIKGVWTWRNFVIGLASVAVAFPIASLIVHYTGLNESASLSVVHSIYTLAGVLAMQIFERIDHIHFSAKVGGIEVKSNGEPQ